MSEHITNSPTEIDLDIERTQVQNADRALFSLLAQFKLRASKTLIPVSEQLQLEEPEKHTAPAGAVCIFNVVAAHINVNELSSTKQSELSSKILSIAKQRIYSVANIGRKKKSEGCTDSYVESTHLAVIERGGEFMNAANGDQDTGKVIAKAVADCCVTMQNTFLNEKKNTAPCEIRQILDALNLDA